MPKATWDDIEGSPWEDDLEDYPVYDGEVPPKGVYRCAMKFLRLKRNRNGEPMLNGLLIVNEPAGSKKSQYNGFDFWFNLNVTNQGSRWVNNFLSALVPDGKAAALRKAFWEKKVMVDKAEPPNVLSIGGVKITENMLLTVVGKRKKEYNSDEWTLDASQFSRPTDLKYNSDGAGPAGDDPESEEDWEEETTEEEVEEVEEEEDPEFDARVDELEAMDRQGLLRAAKAAGISVKRGTPEVKIIDAILEAEFPPEEDGEEEEPEEEEEEVAEEEPEPEPEKPVRTRSRAAAKKPADEPTEESARARTGTRRRRKAGEPPF